jgi:hypothetical protein
LEEKKVCHPEIESVKKASSQGALNGGGDNNFAPDTRTEPEKCSESCLHMQKVMTTLMNNMNEQIEAMRQTLVLLEERLTIVEDQLQGRDSMSST